MISSPTRPARSDATRPGRGGRGDPPADPGPGTSTNEGSVTVGTGPADVTARS